MHQRHRVLPDDATEFSVVMKEAVRVANPLYGSTPVAQPVLDKRRQISIHEDDGDVERSEST
jgi:hypothetical protein